MRDSPNSIAALDGQRVALWGWGREGRAAWKAIRSRRPQLPLTLFCLPDEAVGARATGDAWLAVETMVDADRLAAFDVVVKSPGVSPYRPEALAASDRGTRFIGGTTLWFAERPDARTICVTGTKGKSTTSALLAHLLRAGGHRTALTGNIGQPLLELLEGKAEYWVVELSSYQTRDVALSGVCPGIAVVTNIFPEHLDWHGSEARYVSDKLSLLTDAKPGIAILSANDARLAALDLPGSYVRWFGTDAGWHLRGDVVWRGDEAVFDTAGVPLPGRHNRGNLCAVLATIEALGLDATALAPHAATFMPLPHRLQPVGERDGVLYVNDSISTTPHATLAALEVYRGRRVALLVGGHDRGIDWAPFVAAMPAQAPRAIVTMGQNGPRIHDALLSLADAGGFVLRAASDLADAVAQANALLEGDGVVLLSPGAPSFGAYRDYTERGRHFAALAGFDPDRITTIPGIGIA
ncbi:UDP-N-acetylmuramoyl-L-alanine--D-glutamate ligase [Luteimonas aestuarii]|uniref:UDP-N-acetylmuramoyl-L-alanine--D-glutamate ligase n=1 Tax=Luteimonas aestuarii TaxID=453837 RepID=UPI001FB7B819|nr:UDP-N-acetylmuramoyl-L-alanine--D-glutamate ligase [Luteimonas aestuarii]